MTTLNPVGDVLMVKDAAPEAAPSWEVPTTPSMYKGEDSGVLGSDDAGRVLSE